MWRATIETAPGSAANADPRASTPRNLEESVMPSPDSIHTKPRRVTLDVSDGEFESLREALVYNGQRAGGIADARLSLITSAASTMWDSGNHADALKLVLEALLFEVMFAPTRDDA